jgi:hypothetical protein
MDRRAFYAPDIDINNLAQALGQWYAGQGYQAQSFPSPNGGLTVQARKESTLRTLAGMSSALTVVMTAEGENIAVEVGGAKWVDKAAAGGAGLLLLGPVGLIGAGVGAYQQSQIQSQSWQFIERYIMSNSAYASSAPAGFTAAPTQFGPGMAQPIAPVQPHRTPTTPPPPLNMGATGVAGGAAASANCSQCGQPLRPGAKFCDNCGAPSSSNCRSCSKPLRPGAKFCDECGSPVA